MKLRIPDPIPAKKLDDKWYEGAENIDTTDNENTQSDDTADKSI